MPRNSNFLFNLLNVYHSDNTIELLGYKFHSDDLLLISIIFCLYKEGVKDELLLMSLVLLLFS